MRCSIVKISFCFYHCGLGWCRLGSGNGAEGHEHGPVDGSGVVQEGAGDLLDEELAGFVEWCFVSSGFAYCTVEP